MEEYSWWKWLVGAIVAIGTAIGGITWWKVGPPQDVSESPLIEEKAPESRMGIEGQHGMNPPSYDPTTRKYNYEK
jgi:hypothetical protein